MFSVIVENHIWYPCMALQVISQWDIVMEWIKAQFILEELAYQSIPQVILKLFQYLVHVTDISCVNIGSDDFLKPGWEQNIISIKS